MATYAPVAYTTAASNTQIDFDITFTFLRTTDVVVSVIDPNGNVLVNGTDYDAELQTVNDGTFDMRVVQAGTLNTTRDPLPANHVVSIKRNTDISQIVTVFQDGASFKAADINAIITQLFDKIQEVEVSSGEGIGLTDDLLGFDAENKPLRNLGTPTANNDAMRKIDIDSGIGPDITTVAGIASDVSAVAADNTDIGTVAADLTGTDTIGTVAGAITNVNSVAADLANVNAVAGNATNINAVAGNATNINTVAADAADINTIVANLADITAVAADAADIGAVAANATNINAVAADTTDINAVVANLADITAVAADATDIGTVAADIQVGGPDHVGTVANAIGDVGIVAGNVGQVQTVATNIADVTAVAADAADIGTVSTNIANVTTVATNISDVNTLAPQATNISTLTQAANLTALQNAATNAAAAEAALNAFNATYVGAYATDPSVDANGDALTDGDLYYDTTNQRLKFYDAANSSWITLANSVQVNAAATLQGVGDVDFANSGGFNRTLAGDHFIVRDTTNARWENANAADVQGLLNLPSNTSNDLTALDGRLTTAETNITGNDTDIAALDGRLTTAEGNITSNDTDIAALDGRLTTAESNITGNDTDIAALDGRLTTAESNITGNDTDIAALDGRLTTAEGNITSNDTDIAANASAISTLQSQMTTANSNIASNTTAIAGKQATITTSTALAAASLTTVNGGVSTDVRKAQVRPGTGTSLNLTGGATLYTKDNGTATANFYCTNLAQGDIVTVWSAGGQTRIYPGTGNSLRVAGETTNSTYADIGANSIATVTAINNDFMVVSGTDVTAV